MEISKELIGLIGTVFGAALVLIGQFIQTRTQNSFERSENIRKEEFSLKESSRQQEHKRTESIIYARIEQARQTQKELKEFNDYYISNWGTPVNASRLQDILLGSGDYDIRPQVIGFPVKKITTEAESWTNLMDFKNELILVSQKAIEILGKKIHDGDYYK